MATTGNSAYKVKVGSVPSIANLVPEPGAIIFDLSDSKIKGSNGAVFFDLSGGAGVVYTFQDGLIEAGGTVRLGGTLTQDVTILGNAGAFDVNLQQLSEVELEVGPNLGAAPRSRINMLPSYVLIQREEVGTQSQLNVSGAGMTIMTYNPALKGFFWNATTFTVYDQQQSRGLIYAGDYSANFIDQSLVNKKWVEDNFVAI